MKTKHTRGEWKIETVGIGIHKRFIITADSPICIVREFNGTDRTKEESEANAKLIVKSSAMLKALVKAQTRMEQLINLIPTGKFRNQLTDENIEILQLIND